METTKALTKAISAVAVAGFIALGIPSFSFSGEEDKSPTPSEKVVAFNSFAVGAVLLYGSFMWEYGETAPHVRSEGWFGKQTKHGGADKTGHAFDGYLISRVSASLFESWGYDTPEAAKLAAFSSIVITTAIEVGDSFSDYGFSPQDLQANILGAGLGYLLARYPEAGKLLDFRIEYSPSLKNPKSDPTTDYEHQKYMFALRMAGFDSFEKSPLRFFDVFAGYYTRNFHHRAPWEEKERNLFVGVGIDLAEILSGKPGATVFRYLQPRYTYAEAGENL